MNAKDDCIFCAIVAGAAPCHRVYEDERVLIFMDLFPAASGHTLLIPKRHGANIFETELEDLRAIMTHSKPLAYAIQSVFDCDGIAVIQLNGAAAGQTVFHYHLHLIPRHEGEPFGVHGKKQAEASVLADQAGRLAAAFSL